MITPFSHHRSARTVQPRRTALQDKPTPCLCGCPGPMVDSSCDAGTSSHIFVSVSSHSWLSEAHHIIPGFRLRTAARRRKLRLPLLRAGRNIREQSGPLRTPASRKSCQIETLRNSHLSHRMAQMRCARRWLRAQMARWMAGRKLVDDVIICPFHHKMM